MEAVLEKLSSATWAPLALVEPAVCAVTMHMWNSLADQRVYSVLKEHMGKRAGLRSAPRSRPLASWSRISCLDLLVQKRETERQLQARINSYAYISQKEEEEQWKDLKVWASPVT
eukprot:1160349-Pelagomonas_calceolata.AAC.5